MPLDRQPIVIPMVKGVDQDIDPRVRPIDTPATVTNGRFDKQGAIKKRYGISREANTYNWVDGDSISTSGNVGNARALVSTGDELLMVTSTYVWGLDTSEVASSGILRAKSGWVSPFGAVRRTVFGSSASYVHVDSCHVPRSNREDLICHVAIKIEARGSGAFPTEYYSLVYKCETESGNTVVPERVIAGPDNSGTDQAYACRVIHVTSSADDGNILVVWASDIGGTYSDYHFMAVAASAPEAIHADTAEIVTLSNVGRIGEFGQRTFDVCDSPNVDDEFFVVVMWDSTGGDAILRAYDATNGTQNHTVTITDNDTYKIGALAYDSSNSQVICALFSDSSGTPAGGDHVEAHAFNDSLTRQWGPIVLTDAIGANTGAVTVGTTQVHTIGVGVGDNESGSVRVGVAWSGQHTGTHTTPSGTDPFYTTYITLDGSGGDADRRQEVNSFCLLTQPFWYDGRMFFAGQSVSGALPSFDGFCVMAARTEEATTNPAQIVAHISPGLAGNVGDTGQENIPSMLGAANGVSQDSQSRFVFGVGALNFTMTQIAEQYSAEEHGFAYTNLSSQPNDRYEHQFIALDVSLPITAASTLTGTAVIGGGVVQWTDGDSVVELGYVHPPVPNYATARQGTAGALDAGNYAWYAHWEQVDARGVTHRSMPAVGGSVSGRTLAFPGAGTYDEIDMEFRTLGATSRGTRCSAIAYRNGVDVDGNADATLRRAMGGLRRVRNETNSDLTDMWTDNGQLYSSSASFEAGSEPPLFTETGELEPWMPEGARIVTVANGRLWLAGFAARDRVQYSKKLLPGTGNTQILAPEFHPSWAFSLPDAQACTGLGSLDDKVIAFSARGLWAIAGDGPDVAGQGNDLSGLQALSSDTGCSDPRSVVSWPGGVMFLGKPGICNVGRDLNVTYIGGAVRDTLASYPTVTSAVLVPSQTQVRFTCMNSDEDDSRILVYDYRAQAWTVWHPTNAGVDMPIQGACMHNDIYYLMSQANAASSPAIYFEDTSTHEDQTVFVPLTVRTSWVQAAQPGGWQRVRSIVPILGQSEPSDLTVKIYHDYSDTASNTFTYDAATVSAWVDPANMATPDVRPSPQKCSAISVEISDSEDATDGTGEGFSIAAIRLEVGVKRGRVKTEASKRG